MTKKKAKLYLLMIMNQHFSTCLTMQPHLKSSQLNPNLQKLPLPILFHLPVRLLQLLFLKKHKNIKKSSKKSSNSESTQKIKLRNFLTNISSEQKKTLNGQVLTQTPLPELSSMTQSVTLRSKPLVRPAWISRKTSVLSLALDRKIRYMLLPVVTTLSGLDD